MRARWCSSRIYSDRYTAKGISGVNTNGSFIGAAGPIATITIENLGAPLTIISLTTTVPEPAARAMMIGGIGIVGGALPPSAQDRDLPVRLIAACHERRVPGRAPTLTPLPKREGPGVDS